MDKKKDNFCRIISAMLLATTEGGLNYDDLEKALGIVQAAIRIMESQKTS